MIFNNMSIQVKMVIIIFTVIMIPVSIVGSILYVRSVQAITDQTTKVVISSINYAITNIDTSLENVTGMSKLILTDSNLKNVAMQSDLSFVQKNKSAVYLQILDLLSFFVARIEILNIMEGIDSFYLYLTKQNTLLDSNSTYHEDIVVNNIDFLQAAKDGSFEDNWFVTRQVNYYTLNGIENRLETEKLITYNRVLKDEHEEPIAILAVNVNDEFLSEYYKKIQRGVPGEFIILDAHSTVLASSMQDEIGQTSASYSTINNRLNEEESNSGSFFLEVDNHEQFIVYSKSGYTGWRYIVMIPPAEILGKVDEMKRFLYIFIPVMILVIIGITLLLSRFFYLPLRELIWAMQKTGNGRLDVRIKDNRRDEYAKVYQGFNHMMDEINILIHDLANEKLLKKEAEIKLLQAQINPHFLYNTLDSIYSIAKIKKVEEISLMVAALSKFFRSSLSSGRDTVTLKEAVDLVISYLTILNIRYKGQISFEVDLPEQLKDYLVPKLVLQPIVENAIYHGIQKDRDSGHLKISASSVLGNLHLRVEDNGIGMEEHKLSKLRNSIMVDGYEESSGYALRNLFLQIKLIYGSDYGLFLDSTYGIGTVVTVKLPMVLDGGVDHV